MAKFEGLRLVWLEAFVEVAESGKRTAAAEAMGIHQGTITKHVQKLERWLGRCLVFDDSAPAKLSPDGEEFRWVAKQVLELLDQARAPRVASATPSRPPVSVKDIKIPAPKPAAES